MIFSSSKTLNITEIRINGRQFEKVDSIKFIGVCIDHNFTRKNHITHTSSLFSKITGLIYRACLLLDTTALYSLYNAIFKP